MIGVRRREIRPDPGFQFGARQKAVMIGVVFLQDLERRMERLDMAVARVIARATGERQTQHQQGNPFHRSTPPSCSAAVNALQR